MRKYYSMIICMCMIGCLALTACSSDLNTNTISSAETIDAEYVLESPLPPNPIDPNTAKAVITRLIFFKDGNCRCFYTVLRNGTAPIGDGNSSNYCEYSYSSKTHYICLNLNHSLEQDFTFTASDDLETITAEDETYLKKVK